MELQTETDSVKERLQKTESNRDEYKSKYLQFKGIFQRQTGTFYQYRALSEQCKDALSGIFGGDSFEEFLACGVQPGNIDTLWEFSRNRATKGIWRILISWNRLSLISCACTTEQTSHLFLLFRMSKLEIRLM